MTDYEFDTLVALISRIASREAGYATHQQRAGRLDEDIEEARTILVTED